MKDLEYVNNLREEISRKLGLPKEDLMSINDYLRYEMLFLKIYQLIIFISMNDQSIFEQSKWKDKTTLEVLNLDLEKIEEEKLIRALHDLGFLFKEEKGYSECLQRFKTTYEDAKYYDFTGVDLPKEKPIEEVQRTYAFLVERLKVVNYTMASSVEAEKINSLKEEMISILRDIQTLKLGYDENILKK